MIYVALDLRVGGDTVWIMDIGVFLNKLSWSCLNKTLLHVHIYTDKCGRRLYVRTCRPQLELKRNHAGIFEASRLSLSVTCCPRLHLRR